MNDGERGQLSTTIYVGASCSQKIRLDHRSLGGSEDGRIDLQEAPMDESVAETLATPIERRELIELLQAQHSVNLAVAGVLIAASKSDGPTEQLGETDPSRPSGSRVLISVVCGNLRTVPDEEFVHVRSQVGARLVSGTFLGQLLRDRGCSPPGQMDVIMGGKLLLGVAIMSVSAGLLGGCSTASGASRTSGSGIIAFPQQSEVEGRVSLTGSYRGVLVVEDGCLRVRAPSGVSTLIIWSPTALLVPEGSRLRIVNQVTGRSMRVGDEIAIGGGQVSREAVQGGLATPVPITCADPLLLASDDFGPATSR